MRLKSHSILKTKQLSFFRISRFNTKKYFYHDVVVSSAIFHFDTMATSFQLPEIRHLDNASLRQKKLHFNTSLTYFGTKIDFDKKNCHFDNKALILSFYRKDAFYSNWSFCVEMKLFLSKWVTTGVRHWHGNAWGLSIISIFNE